MSYGTLKLEYENDLVTLTFNRPDKRNAISPGMIDELLAALDEVEKSQARVLILTGAGKAFCAGMDLEALQALAVAPGFSPAADAGLRAGAAHATQDAGLKAGATQAIQDAGLKAAVTHAAQDAGLEAGATDVNLADSRRMARMFRRIYSFPKPVIAAVNGAAIAGGCGIATLCDYTVAVPEAKFGYTEVRIGFMPALVSVFLVRQIGEKRARDLLLSGRLFDAEEARQLGLVSEIVPQERLMQRARELAGTLLEVSPTSLMYTKRLLADLSQKELDRELEIAIHENTRIRSTADFNEGLSAFLKRRKPHWRGQ